MALTVYYRVAVWIQGAKATVRDVCYIMSLLTKLIEHDHAMMLIQYLMEFAI
jgi:hypothetical protein